MNAASTGRVNAHTHIYSGLVPLGMPPPEKAPTNFLETLERVWWRLDRALDENSLRASARLYVAEALMHGTTALIDHHESPEFIEGSLDILADVCQELGMVAVLCYGASERNHGRAEAKLGLAECTRFLDSNDRTLVRGVVGLHAGFTLSDESIRDAATISRDFDVPLHLHVAEDKFDARDAIKRGYEGCIDRLMRLGAMSPRSILAHGVHLTREEVRDCSDMRCWLIQNPRSNKHNRIGYPHFLGQSERVALGTDGFEADMTEEATALLLDGSTHGEDPEVVAARIDAGQELVDEIFEGSPPEVSVSLGHIEVEGRTIVDEGRLVSADLEAIRAEARDEAQRLWKRMTEL